MSLNLVFALSLALPAGHASGPSATASAATEPRWDNELAAVHASLERDAWEEALELADQMASSGAPRALVDYATGLSWHRAATLAIANGQTGSGIGHQLEDARRLLARALASDAERCSGAWLPLAEAAWLSGEIEQAADAADRAVELAPHSAAAHGLRGRVGLARYSAMLGAKEGGDDQALFAIAHGSLTRAIELEDDAATARIAELRVQLALVHAWKGDLASAGSAWGAAMAGAPEAVDFGAALNTLGAPAFGGVVARAIPSFRDAHPSDDPGLAILHWWHGYAAHLGSDWSTSESAFRAALHVAPEYVSSWYYVHRAAYASGDFGAAVAALRTHADADLDAAVALVRAEGDPGSARLDWLVGWCANPDKHDGQARNADAALLTEVLTQLAPTESRHWNNLGLFLRDQGDVHVRRAIAAQEAPDRPLLEDLFERALDAYRQALELDPENPNYLNDTAVMLHYNLRRDLDEARELYASAARIAEARLSAPEAPGALSPLERELLETALRDARENMGRLDRARRAAEDTSPTESEPEPSTGADEPDGIDK